MRQIILIAHNLRSAHNVGSLLRTAEGLGVKKVYLTGYTPYPKQKIDNRLPHMANKTQTKISKTALGAELKINNQHLDEIEPLINQLRQQGYTICALEQDTSAIKLLDYKAGDKVALIVGREVEGIETKVLAMTDQILEIPMFGKKESFNVAQATAMGLYHLKFT